MKKVNNYFEAHYSGNLIDVLELIEEELVDINPYDNSTLIVEFPHKESNKGPKDPELLDVLVHNEFFEKAKIWRSLIPEICKAAVKHFAETYDFEKIDVRYKEIRETTNGLSITFECSKLED